MTAVSSASPATSPRRHVPLPLDGLQPHIAVWHPGVEFVASAMV
jgi:hypothetical protein